MIGNHSSEMLSTFVKKNFTEASVVGVGVSHDELKAFAKRLRLPEGEGRTIEKSTFIGGADVRKENASGLAYVALAVEGASFGDTKAQIASALVQRALGSGPRTKRGLNLGGKLSSVVSGDLNLKAGVTTFSTNYTDSGLVGVFIAATPCSVDGVTRKAAEVLRSGNLADEDLARAKQLLKADIAYALESDGGYLEEIGLQTLLTGSVTGIQEVNSAIDGVSANDLNSILSRGKLTMAAYGKIANVPFVDQLK
jgi:predicted Zn-dependent peptidase